MIHEAVLESYRKYPEDTDPDAKGFSVTSISICPYQTYLNFHKLDPITSKGDPQQVLNMKNGHWQEQEMKEDLRHAGYQIKGEQLTVHVGRAMIPGHIDGQILIEHQWPLLEVKALNLRRYQDVKSNRLEHEIGVRTQIQSYMESEELRDQGVERTLIYCKHKDRNQPWSFFLDRNPDYIQPVIEATDRIVLDGYEPPKEEIAKCKNCGHRPYCWGNTDSILDMSKFGVESLPEWVETWKEGKIYKDLGKWMVDEAKEAFQAAIGRKEREVLIGDLKIRNIPTLKAEMSKRLFIEKYGIEALPGIMEEKKGMMMRVDQL